MTQRASGGNPGHDEPDAAGVLDLDPGSEIGTGPGSPSGPNPEGGHARERRGEAAAAAQATGAGGCGCPERPSSYSGITLSDEGAQGERTRTRRSARPTGISGAARNRRRSG